MVDNRAEALAYPTIRRKANVIGKTQIGTKCQLSANSGLPAIVVPWRLHAGRTAGRGGTVGPSPIADLDLSEPAPPRTLHGCSREFPVCSWSAPSILVAFTERNHVRSAA
jgi:hypothetical protein